MIDQLNRVLLIDDDEVTNIMHRRVIEKMRPALEVNVATDGNAALDLLERYIAEDSSFPDLIVLDVNMPGMGGFEFLDEYVVRGMGTSGKRIILVLSSSVQEAQKERAMANPNVHSVVDKLMSPENFLKLVDEFI